MTPIKIPIKIVCGCGQKYAFDVYPANGRMPAPIHCPVCGADGTAVANEIIALALGLRPVANLPALLPQTSAEAVREALAPHLAQVVKEVLVQELAAQRRELLRVQEDAAVELAALIRRLDSLQAPMAERLRAYETRIQELEKELAARTEENRELLKLKIEMLRRQLETERTRNRVEFN
jgi:Na+/phosphate symporter